MAQIAIYNEWSRLEEVILGIVPALYIPAPHPIEQEPINPWWKRVAVSWLTPIVQGKRVPGWMRQKYLAELNALEQVLYQHGVIVRRPQPVTPLANEPLGLVQMFARDPLMAVGNKLFVGQLQIAMRRKERRGFDGLLGEITKDGGLVDSNVPAEAYIEGGDVIVDLPYVYVGVGKYASNMAGVDWLQAQLGTAVHVVPVPLAVDGILHLDCCMTLIGPKLGIIHRAALIDPLPPPLDSYDFIEVGASVRHELGTNVLLLDSKTIVVQARHVQLQKVLCQRGFKVIPLDFTWHAHLGGAFRCATAPIRRRREVHTTIAA